MTELIDRLRAALDQAQHRAEQAHDDEVEWIGDDAAEHGCTDSGHFIKAWSPDRVLRLIASHRQVLEDLDVAEAALNERVAGFTDDQYGALVAATARCKEARRQVERVAEFWLGSTDNQDQELADG